MDNVDFKDKHKFKGDYTYCIHWENKKKRNEEEEEEKTNRLGFTIKLLSNGFHFHDN